MKLSFSEFLWHFAVKWCLDAYFLAYYSVCVWVYGRGVVAQDLTLQICVGTLQWGRNWGRRVAITCHRTEEFQFMIVEFQLVSEDFQIVSEEFQLVSEEYWSAIMRLLENVMVRTHEFCAWNSWVSHWRESPNTLGSGPKCWWELLRACWECSAYSNPFFFRCEMLHEMV